MSTGDRSHHRLGLRLTLVVLVAASLAVPIGAAGLEDVTPPFLVDFTISPTIVDVSTGPASLTFTAELTDDLAGVAGPGTSSSPTQATFVSPSGGQSVGAVFYEAPVAGDALDGTWTYVAEVPQHAESGTWEMEYFLLVDVVGNSAYLTPADVAGMGLPTSFEVTGLSDTTPPTLVDFSIDPVSVDISTSSATLTFTVSLTDDVAGVRGEGGNSSPTQVSFRSPSGAQLVGAVFYEAPISGSPLNGTWTYQATLPRYSESGTWVLESFHLYDVLGNHAELTAGDLVAMGLPVSFEVTGLSDTTPPTLLDFSIDPILVDVSEGPANVTFTVDKTDDLAGFVCGIGECYTTQARFVSPNAGQSIDAVFFGPPVSGDALAGTWEFVAEVPQYAEAGTWELLYFSVVDVLGNSIILWEADVAAMGLPTFFEVFGSNLSVVTAEVESPTGGTVTVTPVPPTPGEAFLDGYLVVGSRLSIEAPDATPGDPLIIEFSVDPGALPAGMDVGGLVVFRNGVAIPPCVGTPGTADPDPCVASRDDSGSPWIITVLTSQASLWALGLADGDGDGIPDGVDVDGSISGRVTDVDSGDPIANVAVSVWSVSGDYLADASTQIDGAYSIDGLMPGEAKVRFEPFGSEHVTEWWEDREDFETAEVVVVNADERVDLSPGLSLLDPGAWATVSGRVTEEGSGFGIADVSVTVWDESWNWLGSAQTDFGGYYAVDGLPTGEVKVQFEGSSDHVSEWFDNATSFFSAEPVPVAVGETTVVDAALAVGAVISGRVTQEGSDDGIGGVYVSVVTASEWLGGVPTDADGFYMFSGVPGGMVKVYFQAPWGSDHISEWYDDKESYVDATPVPVVAGEVTRVDAQLTLGATISGLVTDAGGVPLGGVAVYAMYEDGSGGFVQRGINGYTFGDGLYTIRGLPLGSVRVHFDPHSNHVNEYWNDKSAITEADPVVVSTAGEAITGINAALSVGGSITGTVTDPDGDPVPFAFVTVLYNTWVPGDGYFYPVASYASADHLGVYTAVGLPTGNYKVFVASWSHGDLVPAFFGGELGWGAGLVPVVLGTETTNVDVQLRLGGSISGTVTSSGAPLAWAEVTVFDLHGVPMRGAIVEANGEYTVSGLPEEGVRVLFGAPEADTIHVAEYYNDAGWAPIPGPASAEVVPVTLGSNTPGIDADLAVANLTAVLGPNSSIATGDGATPDDPFAVSVEVPIAGQLVVVTTDPGEDPSGYELFGQMFDLSFTGTATPANPFVLVFTVDASVVPAGTDIEDVVVFRNGDPVGSCPGSSVACVSGREMLGDGDFEFTVLTSAMSQWSFGTATETSEITIGGFYAPVDMNGVWNVVRSGSTVPLKFEAFEGITERTDLEVVESFAVYSVSCNIETTIDDVEYTTTDGVALRYDASSGQFVRNWKTPKDRAGSCWRVMVTIEGGAPAIAYFKLK